MQLPRQIFYSWRTLAIPALLLAPWGCQEQPRVSEYVVAPDANMTSGSTSGGSNADATPARTLAAAIYRPDATWFFKLMGNPEAVAGQQKNFETLLGSLGVDGKSGELAWKLPEGWTETKGQGLRFATLKPPGEPGLEVAVNRFEGVAGSLLANVNRWRGELGLAPEEAGALEKGLAKIKLESGAEEALLVDITGKGPMGGEQRLLGAIIRRADALWFVKLTGEPTEVAGVREGFDNLVRSLKFE